jgi:hypothetical protein
MELDGDSYCPPLPPLRTVPDRPFRPCPCRLPRIGGLGQVRSAVRLVDCHYPKQWHGTIMPQDQTTTSSMYCRKCGYQLEGLLEFRCPECGQPFDPDSPRTFLRHPNAWRRRLWLRRVLIALGSLVIMLLAGLGVLLGTLYLQWRAEQPVIAAIRQAGGTVDLATDENPRLRALLGIRSKYRIDPIPPPVEPLGPHSYGPDTPGLLGTRFAYLLEKAELVYLAGLHFDPLPDDYLGRKQYLGQFQDPLPVDDAWLQRWEPSLRELPRLNVLIIASDRITDRGLKALQPLPPNVRLKVYRPLAAPRGQDELNQTQPDMSVEQKDP